MATKEKVSATKLETDDETPEGMYRLSISIDPSHRRHLRIAAAMADMTVGEWATKVLVRAADKAIAQGGDDDES